MSYQSPTGDLLTFLGVIFGMLGFLSAVIAVKIPIFWTIAVILVGVAVLSIFVSIIVDGKYTQKVKKWKEEHD